MINNNLNPGVRQAANALPAITNEAKPSQSARSLVLALWVFIFFVVFSSWSEGAVEREKLFEALYHRRDRVVEFRAIRELADRLNIRAWLFGGSVSAFANYVLSDLEHETKEDGDDGKEFDYQWRKIYRTTQDVDILVSGTEEQAKVMQDALQILFPYMLPPFLGDKTSWEVRMLSHPLNAKIAILENPEFLNMHSDSHSVTALEITDPDESPLLLRDVHEWKAMTPTLFFEDLLNHEISYLYNPAHRKTKKFLKGRNPEIFSVVRVLTKALQYRVRITAPKFVEKKFFDIIRDFDPDTDLNHPLTLDRFRRLVLKMLINASDVEDAWITLRQIGLWKKLATIGNAKDRGSVAYWMFKNPLLSKRIGLGDGPTASELGIHGLIHEFGETWELESLQHSLPGRLNLFSSELASLSSFNCPNQACFFSVRDGEALTGKGFPVRFYLKPEARKGSDFEVSGTEVFVLNRAALEVDESSLAVSRENFERFFEAVIDHLSPVRPGQQGYFSSNAKRMLSKLDIVLSLSPVAETAAQFVGQIEVALQRGKISSKDYRRLLARVMARIGPNPTFIADFENLYARSDLLKETLMKRRDVFAHSKQPDAREVAITFEAIENRLNCAKALLNHQW